MNSFNTNINDYTIDELLSLLGLKTPTNNEINEKIYYLTEDRFKNNNNIRTFFYNVQNKLLNNNQNENNYIQDNILPKYDFYENFENFQRNKHNINDEYTNEEYTNEEYTNEEYTNDEYTNEKDTNEEYTNEEYTNEEYTNDEYTNDEYTNDEYTKEEETNEENTNEENTNEENTNEEDIINNDKKILDINDINGNYKIDKNINFKTEFIYIIKNLYFNTLFRENSLHSYNTNSNFLLSESINNIIELRLSEICFKKPFLISKSKSNNKFIIKKYDTSLNNVFCEFPIILDDGYYENITTIENEINNILKNFDTNNIQSYNSIDSNDLSFIRHLNFSINPNNLRSKFELSYNELEDISFHRFELDFKSYYTPYYSLAYILGFNKNEKKYDSYYNSNNIEITNNDIILTEPSNNSIMSPYTFKNNDNNDVFFCLDEHIVNTQENHALFYNKNIISNKILAKVSTYNVDKNNIINIQYNINTEENTVRKYEGPINLLNFNIKLIDYYGNLINTNDNENITFGLRLKIKSKRII
jgi:hypothetical protein